MLIRPSDLATYSNSDDSCHHPTYGEPQMSTLIRKLYHVKHAAGLLIVLAAVVSLVGCPGPPEEPSQPVAEPSPPAPQPVGPPVAEADLPPVVGHLNDLQLQMLYEAHEPLTLDSLKDQVVLINFWGPWCPPCKRELPHMADISEKYAYTPSFRIVTVAYPYGMSSAAAKPGVESDVKNLFDAMNIDGLPVWYDENGQTQAAVERSVGFNGFPTTILMDRAGGIRKVWTGYAPGVETQMQEMINLLLRFKPQGSAE